MPYNFSQPPIVNLLSYLGGLMRPKDPNAVQLPDLNDATPGGYDPAAYGRAGETVGAQNWSDYNVPTDIPTGINPNTGETVVLNPFYVNETPQTWRDQQLANLDAFTQRLNDPTFGDTSIRLVSDPFQMANYIGTAQTGGQTTGTMGPQPANTPSGQPAGDVTLTGNTVNLPAFNVAENRIKAEDLGFGGNVFTPGAGLPMGQIETGPSGVSTFVPAAVPTATSTVATTTTPGVTLAPGASLVGPVSDQELLNSLGGNINLGTVNPQLVIGGSGQTGGPIVMSTVTATGTNVGTGGVSTGGTGIPSSSVMVTPGSLGGNTLEGGTMSTVTATSTTFPTTTATNATIGFSGDSMLQELIRRQPPIVMSTVTSSTSTVRPTNVSVAYDPNATISLSGLGQRPSVGPTPYVPPASTATTTATSTATSTGTVTVTGGGGGGTGGGGGGSTTPSLPSIGGGQGRNYRDFALELGETSAALRAKQADLLNMYGGIYQNFLGQTAIPGAATSAASDLASTQQRLANVRAGTLSPEDIRNSQQAAREAYAARGQVMGPNAVGAEILNRENVRQQREAQAMQAYQNAMGNTLNVANLQTGNIFQPIGSLISGTFNPLSPYAADVYGTNVNAQLARDIAAQNNAAAIQAAQLGASATRSAANTGAIANALGNTSVVKGVVSLFGIPAPSCMPGNQCIDTPNGPVEIQHIKGGDIVIGYDGEPAYVAQVSSWNQDPFRGFFTFMLDDGSKFTVCDDHKIMNIPAMEWVEGAVMGGRKIAKIEVNTGHMTSYDLMTNQIGYRINGVPVNSMIPEIILAAAKHIISVNQNVAEIIK